MSNQTKHMIMINKIKELLDQGKDVYLECTNEYLYLRKKSRACYEENKHLLLSTLKVDFLLDGRIHIKDCKHGIQPKDQRYFKIKGDNSD